VGVSVARELRKLLHGGSSRRRRVWEVIRCGARVSWFRFRAFT